MFRAVIIKASAFVTEAGARGQIVSEKDGEYRVCITNGRCLYCGASRRDSVISLERDEFVFDNGLARMIRKLARKISGWTRNVLV